MHETDSGSLQPSPTSWSVIARWRSRVIRYRRLGICGLFLVSLFALYGDTIVAHVVYATNPYVFNDDARQQIFPFYRYWNATLFRADYISDYYLSSYPLGYRWFYAAFAHIIDPMWLSKCLPYPALLLTLVAMGISGWKLGGKLGAWGTVALCLGNALFLGRMAGGLPRTFAFPLLAWAIAALARGRVRQLGVVVCLGAAFYPVTGVVAGLSLALTLFALPSADRGDAGTWPMKKRVVHLCLVAGVALLLVLPTLLLTRAYGPLLSPRDVDAFPEMGAAGRYGPEDRAPFPNIAREVRATAALSMIGDGGPLCSVTHWAGAPRRLALLDILLALSVACWLIKMRSSAAARRVALAFVSVLIAYGLSAVYAPRLYLPQRYLAYAIPLLAVLLVTTGLDHGLPRRWFTTDRPHAWTTKGLQGIAIGVVLLYWGGRGDPLAGFTIRIPKEVGIYRRIAELPADAVIAGWPDDAIDNVPYLSRRAALVTSETHQAFHRGYTLEMRRRMRALIDAYFASTTPPLTRLQREFGVTHLLVNLDHYRERPRYFAPFDGWIRDALQRQSSPPIELSPRMKTAAIYREGSYVLLDLRRIVPHMPPADAAAGGTNSGQSANRGASP